MLYTASTEQLKALCELLSLRKSQSNDALRLHLVEGLSVPDAARRAGCTYTAAWKAVQRAQRGVRLAWIVADAELEAHVDAQSRFDLLR